MSNPSELLNCTQCSHQTASAFQLNHHVRRKHVNNAAKLFHAIVEPEQFFCVFCDHKSHHQIELYEHYKQAHNRARGDNTNGSFRQYCTAYLCEYCKYASDSSLFVTKHRNLCRKTRKRRRFVPPPVEDPVQVTVSDSPETKPVSFGDEFAKYLSNRQRWEVIISEGVTLVQCDQCSYRSIRRADLQRHMMQHASEAELTWFQCDECSYRAIRKSSLRTHMLQHAAQDEIVWFECAECSYRTKRKCSLKEHVSLVHAAGDRIDWLQCDRCSYRAKVKSYLKRHMLQHAADDEINWFRCAHCSHRTKRHRSLKKHVMRKHAGM